MNANRHQCERATTVIVGVLKYPDGKIEYVITVNPSSRWRPVRIFEELREKYKTFPEIHVVSNQELGTFVSGQGSENDHAEDVIKKRAMIREAKRESKPSVSVAITRKERGKDLTNHAMCERCEGRFGPNGEGWTVEKPTQPSVPNTADKLNADGTLKPLENSATLDSETPSTKK